MNILGVGSWELIFILLIALIVAGPKRMLQWAYILGKYIGYLRVMWGRMMQQLQKEFDEAGVDIKLPKDIPTRRDLSRLASRALEPVTTPMRETMDELNKEANLVRDSMSGVPNAANGKLHPDGPPSASDAPDDPKPSRGFGTWSGAAKTDDNQG